MEKQTRELLRNLAIDAVILATLAGVHITNSQAPKELKEPEIERKTTEPLYRSPDNRQSDPTDRIYVV
tara:strand:- start:312 stop:515 length:204 start_codon:yes stop_codon:yes gene_type:complete